MSHFLALSDILLAFLEKTTQKRWKRGLANASQQDFTASIPLFTKKSHFAETKNYFTETKKLRRFLPQTEKSTQFLFYGRNYWIFAIECGAPSTKNLSDFSLDDEVNVAVQRLLYLFIFPVIEQRNSLVVQTLHGLLSIGDATIFQREINHG